jgi:pyrroline-5-carboxylate reductase
MNEKNVLLIGGGNMGSALLRGIIQSGLAPARKITVIDILPGLLETLRSRHGVNVDVDPVPHVAAADVIILAVKPQILPKVAADIRDSVRPSQLVISILAGVESTRIRDLLGKNNPVVRVMPNIAATVDAAASAVAGCDPATEEHYQVAETLFGAVGIVVRVEEKLLDAVTGLSGSGPAYVYTVIEALCDGGVHMGLPRDVAMKLAAQTVLGAARQVQESGDHPAVLRDRVTTPGGTTAAALRELEDRGLRAALMSAVAAATARSRELNRKTEES